MNNTVKTNLSQSLTDAQKQQARTNIGCPDDSGLVHISKDEIISGVKIFTANITVKIGDNSVLLGLDSDGKAYILHTDNDRQSTTSVVYYDNSGSYHFTGKADSATTADSASKLSSVMAAHDGTTVAYLNLGANIWTSCANSNASTWFDNPPIVVADGHVVLVTVTGYIETTFVANSIYLQLGTDSAAGGELPTSQTTYGGTCKVKGNNVTASIAWRNNTGSTVSLYPQLCNTTSTAVLWYLPHTSVIVI